MRQQLVTALILGTLLGGMSVAGEATRSRFGTLADGRTVDAVTLKNAHGVSATVITYGAALQSMMLPDRGGQFADVTLGYPSLDGYLRKPEYFGATVGRFANRIAQGAFTLDGKRYQTPKNNNGNSLHGGERGFDKVLWELIEVQGGDKPAVKLRYVSPDGDQGYPGTLTAYALYSLDDHNALTIEYTATTDKPTVVNISNHAYWNLAGEGASSGAMGHLLTIHAEAYTPVDSTLIPSGEIRPVAGTVFDFKTAHPVGARVRNADEPQLVFGRGYDHNFVIAREVGKSPRLQAAVQEPVSGGVSSCGPTSPGCNFIRAISWTARSRASRTTSIGRVMPSCSSRSCSPIR